MRALSPVCCPGSCPRPTLPRPEHPRRRQDLDELAVAALAAHRFAADEPDRAPRDGRGLVPIRPIGLRFLADRRRLSRPLEERLGGAYGIRTRAAAVRGRCPR